MFKLRYFLVVGFAILGVAAGVVASNIGPLTKQEEYLPRDDPLMTL